MKFSANLGFLWTDRSLPDAIRAAKAAGFDAVECHWPYKTPPEQVAEALHDVGLPMLGLNTSRGNAAAGDSGLTALPERESEARHAIDEAIAYAVAIGAQNVHVMAGFATGVSAQTAFLSNLGYACSRARRHGITILIEPLNRHDAPGYFLHTTNQAADIIAAMSTSNLKLMFDCYHVQRSEGDVSHRLRALRPIIGHIQFASVPDRGPPDHGELNYSHVFSVIAAMGWNTPLGTEYKPGGDTAGTLGWMNAFRRLSC